ncbi:DUF423 domain-containing protein [Salirhabdus salicampi]|uniref:DUF423 domain-containing protein n=1 Tax=Salirhabdus salicampi TaxID=476102 RepID=UPI0020C1F0A8|nr:DUF423 domain-containing protein [Salirhabdus salicampi]MCP8617382.1 DUF423 domain-containing protein [Salirhabdus salicampi]
MKLFLLLGAINGFLTVALGAFGAHGLEGKVSEKMLNIWEKAVQYQMFHTIGLFIVAFLVDRFSSTTISGAGWFFLVGIVLFSGSLYIYTVTNVKVLAMITPIGGVAFLIGWVMLFVAILKSL